MPNTLMSYKDAAKAISNLGGVEAGTILQELRNGISFEVGGRGFYPLNSLSVRVSPC